MLFAENNETSINQNKENEKLSCEGNIIKMKFQKQNLFLKLMKILIQ